MMDAFVKTELEYTITVARAVFDLVQEAVATIWNDLTTLDDEEQNALKKHKLPASFTKAAIRDRGEAKPVEELTGRYAITEVLAQTYHVIAPFYVFLLNLRDRIIHGGSSVETIFVTEKGFCVDPERKMFRDSAWRPEHRYNDSVVSLMPWIAHVVFSTIQACNLVMTALASSILLPPEVAPGYRVFIRNPANDALSELWKVAAGEIIWWSDAETPDGSTDDGALDSHNSGHP